MTDEEYLWQPVPGALAVVRRTGTTRRVTRAGEWVAEWPRGGTEWTRGDDDPGARTIGWLVTHLVEVFTERWSGRSAGTGCAATTSRCTPRRGPASPR